MRAVAVPPEPQMAAFAGEPVAWCYAARLTTPVSTAAVTWARAAFEHAHPPMRMFLIAGWAVLLLRGRPRSDASHVLGWPIALSMPTTAVLQRESRLGIRATLVFATQPQAVTFFSGMVYTSRLGRIVWTGLAPLHRWASRAVLTRAAVDLARPRSAGQRLT